jgi:hypothetical protein
VSRINPKKGELTQPPPVIPMKTYINDLKRQARQQSGQDYFTSSNVKESIPPLLDQLNYWIRDTPQALLEKGWLLSDICSKLRGRYRPQPHPSKVAQVLRQLGWQQVRQWTKDCGGRRIWYPPPPKALDL